MKTIKHILVANLFLCFFFLQGQNRDELFLQQISELTEQRNFIERSACPQNETILKNYHENFDLLINALNLAFACRDIPDIIEASRIKEQTDKYVKYQSTNLINIIVKRFGKPESHKSSLKKKSDFETEEFSIANKNIEARYKRTKNNLRLISFEVIYDSKKKVYIDLIYPSQPSFYVYQDTENRYSDELQVLFNPHEIGKINLLNVNKGSYELYRGRYTEMLKDSPNQGIIKHKYAIRCSDSKGNSITPTKKGKDIAVTPTNFLLWYTGNIGKYPIKLMLKRGYNKESDKVEISQIAYGYDSKEELIYIADLMQPLENINAYEGERWLSPKWNVDFEYNTVLKGTWDDGKVLPINLKPLTKKFPEFTYKVKIKEELSNLGNVTNQFITALTIYEDNKTIQTILIDEQYDLDYFELSYSDVNYDGYLDLILNNYIYFYQPKTNKFKIDTTLEDEYFPELTELSNYNLFTKSITAQQTRSSIEYRAINRKLIPYQAESYFMNQDGDMVFTKQKYENGKWKVIEEHTESIEEDEEISVSPDNFNLLFNIDINSKKIYFSPVFRNEIGVIDDGLLTGQKAKLYTELKGKNGETQRQFLYDVSLDHGESQMLDDSELVFDGKEYFLLYSDALLPFFPLNLNEKEYSLSLVIEHPKFGKVKSEAFQIKLPLQIDAVSNTKHLTGNINAKVNGDLYCVINNNKVVATFINAKTDQRIKLKGTIIGKKVNLTEYKETGEISGFFEGEYNNEIYKGNWLSPDRKTSVPFQFKDDKKI